MNPILRPSLFADKPPRPKCFNSVNIKLNNSWFGKIFVNGRTIVSGGHSKLKSHFLVGTQQYALQENEFTANTIRSEVINISATYDSGCRLNLDMIAEASKLLFRPNSFQAVELRLVTYELTFNYLYGKMHYTWRLNDWLCTRLCGLADEKHAQRIFSRFCKFFSCVLSSKERLVPLRLEGSALASHKIWMVRNRNRERNTKNRYEGKTFTELNLIQKSSAMLETTWKSLTVIKSVLLNPYFYRLVLKRNACKTCQQCALIICKF